MNSRDYGLYILGRRGYSQKEFENKLLKKGFEREETLAVVQEFLQRGWLNDYLYGESYARSKFNYSNKSKLQVEQSLFKKGIDKEVVADIIKSCDNHEVDSIKALMEKMCRYKLLTREILIRRLLARGFSLEHVLEVLDSEFSE